YGDARHRGAATRFRHMVCGSTATGCRAEFRRAACRPRRLHESSLRDVPPHPGHRSGRRYGAGPHARRQQADACSRDAPHGPQQSCSVDHRSAKHKAGLQDADDGADRRPAECHRSLSGEPQVSRSDVGPMPRTLRDSDLDQEGLHRRLSASWATRSGLIGALSSVDHKIVARRYLITAFVFLCFAGLSAVVMRLQLSGPEHSLVGPDLYDQLFTMHGVTMMFLFAVPIMQAAGIYLVPLMVGTRNIAFPRLNAFSYWIYLSGGIFVWVSFLLNMGPDIGWFAYVPLSGPE